MTVVAEAARRLRDAARTGRACPPVRDLLGADDVETAYLVQQELTRGRLAGGAHLVGRKIGLTSEAVQRQLGVDQPDFGVLFDDMAVPDGGSVPMSRLLQPKVEAEIAFVLGADLDADLSAGAVRAAVDHAVVALEIVDSRIEDWDISVADTVADNASSGLFVLGRQRLALTEFEPREVVMTMSVDGEPASSGLGVACMGDPLVALAWLGRTANGLGDPLHAGQVVLSGALGPMVAATPGSRVEASLTDGNRRWLGGVSATFGREGS